VDDEDLRGRYNGVDNGSAPQPYLPISKNLVLDLIALLQEHLARLERPGGRASGAYATYRLMAGTSYALACLLALRATSARHSGTLELMRMVQHFLDDPSAAEHLHALPRHRDLADLVEALLILADKKHQPPSPAP
jgi:hypothetical protein